METYAIWVTAISTGVIAIFTVINFWLILTIKSRDNEFRQQVSDLYKAIVISNIVGGPHDTHLAIEDFKIHYEKAGGKTTILN
jgi:hypothetical protein